MANPLMPPQAIRPAPAHRRSTWRGMLMRPSLLSLTAAAVGVSAIAHAVTIAGGTTNAASTALPPTRMGVSIQQSLSERDQELTRRTRAATLREQSARATEQRLKADLEARGSRPEAPGAAGARDTQDIPQPLEDLARIYQTMRPARAAPIFAALDLDVQTQIARHMRERAVALIMGNMEPGAAVRLSMALAGRRPAQLLPPAIAPIPYAEPPSPRSGLKTDYAPADRPIASGGRSTPTRPRMTITASPRPHLQPPRVRVQAIATPRGQAPSPAQVQSLPLQGTSTPAPATPAAAKP